MSILYKKNYDKKDVLGVLPIKYFIKLVKKNIVQFETLISILGKNMRTIVLEIHASEASWFFNHL